MRVSLSGKHHYRKKAKIILFLLLLPRAKVRPDALLPVVLVVGIMVTRLLPDKNQCFAALVAEFFLWPDMVDLFNLLAGCSSLENLRSPYVCLIGSQKGFRIYDWFSRLL